jgi:hypothetical protein
MTTPGANIILDTLDTNDRIAFGVYADIFRPSEGVLVDKLFIGFRHHTTVSQGGEASSGTARLCVASALQNRLRSNIESANRRFPE